ncbi:MAG: helix-turn-helix domain-containing protein [Syntrophomonadaceae bacterium]|nr:helix-turn-helix domain-containing protein [Syntrophomonadaceae bacterium]
MAEDFQSRVPWSTEPGLKQKTREVGIDFDRFIEQIAANRSDVEIASDFGVPIKVITHLRDHFLHLGIHSIVGQD